MTPIAADAAVRIAPLQASPELETALSELLVAVVAAGGSVHFMHPLALEDARAYWRKALGAAGRGERIMLGAWDGGELLGTVSLHLDTPPNQPHRAEIAKLMTAPAARRRGVGRALMQAAEALAREAGRTLLVLDTAAEDGGAPLYRQLGWQEAGTIPDYAYRPRGGLTATLIFYKRLEPGPRP